MASESPPTLENQKLQHEVKKLKTEALFIPLGFVAQIFNSFCILGLGALVLFSFQRPQIEEQEKSRLAATNNNIGTLMVSIMQMSDKNARSKAVRALERLFPGHPEIADIAQSDDDLVIAENNATQVRKPADTAQNEEIRRQTFCELSAKDLTRLKASLAALNVKLDDERLGRTGNPPGFGPIAVAIRRQTYEVEQGIANIQKTRTDNRCPP
jgi:hypothetical protein